MLLLLHHLLLPLHLHLLLRLLDFHRAGLLLLLLLLHSHVGLSHVLLLLLDLRRLVLQCRRHGKTLPDHHYRLPNNYLPRLLLHICRPNKALLLDHLTRLHTLQTKYRFTVQI